MMYTDKTFYSHTIYQKPYSVFGSTEAYEKLAQTLRHTSRHVPFYFSIVGQNRHVPRKDGKKYQTKFNRNVRPRGTHSHFKFYR